MNVTSYQTNEGVRLYPIEAKALKYALEGFQGEVHIFGSRADLKAKGGDIDILLKPQEELSSQQRWDLSMQVQSRFETICEMTIDVVIWDENNVFCQEGIINAKKIDLKKIGK